jgi:hypothetical protein
MKLADLNEIYSSSYILNFSKMGCIYEFVRFSSGLMRSKLLQLTD